MTLLRYAQWLVWRGPVTDVAARRAATAFRASFGQTMVQLKDEIAHLGAREALIETGHLPHERVKSGEPNMRYPLYAECVRGGVRVSFVATSGPLAFATDRFIGWEANLRAIALGLTALRAVDRYGIGHTAEQYAGWSALPPATPMPAPMTNERATAIIRRLAGPGAGDLPITKAWRLAVKAAHPDVNGGRADDWADLEPAGRQLGPVR